MEKSVEPGEGHGVLDVFKEVGLDRDPVVSQDLPGGHPPVLEGPQIPDPDDAVLGQAEHPGAREGRGGGLADEGVVTYRLGQDLVVGQVAHG
jgi:hypothetical protein